MKSGNRQLVTLSALALILLLLLLHGRAFASPRVGIFYFPGWKDNALGLAYNPPWDRIKPFPDRKPVLGWYAEGDQRVMDTQLEWMRQHGLSFVVFSWYWGGQFEVLGHAAQAYQRSRVVEKIPYALMWANHGRAPTHQRDFLDMVRDLIERHWQRPDYLRVDDRPVFMIMVPDSLDSRARAFGSDTGTLLAEAQKMARDAGLPPILFMAGAGGGANAVTTQSRRWGYSAYFAYNYHTGIGGQIDGESRMSHSYAELDLGYREHWDWFITRADLPYLLPMTAGWDKRPWGGSRDPRHDQSWPNRGEFEAHLRAGRDRLLRFPYRTLGGFGIVCCWNEFGEGSIVEPTEGLGFQRLRGIREIFGER